MFRCIDAWLAWRSCLLCCLTRLDLVCPGFVSFCRRQDVGCSPGLDRTTRLLHVVLWLGCLWQSRKFCFGSYVGLLFLTGMAIPGISSPSIASPASSASTASGPLPSVFVPLVLAQVDVFAL